MLKHKIQNGSRSKWLWQFYTQIVKFVNKLSENGLVYRKYFDNIMGMMGIMGIFVIPVQELHDEQSIFHKESQRTLWQMRWAVSVSSDVCPGIHLSGLHQFQLNCSLNWVEEPASRSYTH